MALVNTPTRIVVALSLAALVVSIALPLQAQGPGTAPLFADVPSVVAQAAVVLPARTRRQRLVSVRTDILAAVARAADPSQRRLRLNLFADLEVDVLVSDVTSSRQAP